MSAALWYDKQRMGLGDEFISCVEESLAKIARDSTSSTVVDEAVSRILIRRFPYGIFFLTEPERIVVLGVLHHRRDPQIWQQRR